MLKIFGPTFWGTNDPDFSTAYCWRKLLTTVWQSLVEFRLLVSVCKACQWSRQQNLCRVGKMAVEFEAVCGPKFILFWDDVGDPFWLSTHVTDCLYRVSFRRHGPLNCWKVAKSAQKDGFGPRFVGGGDTPDFGHAFSNCTYFRAWKKKEERISAKYKSADILCRTA